MRLLATPLIAFALVLPATAGARDADPVKVDRPKNLAGVQSVVIGSFAVAFVVEKTDEAFAGPARGRTAVITRAKLAPVDPAVFQAITDAAFADFQTRLTGAGFTIADRGPMLADSHFVNAGFAAPGAEGTLRFGKDSKVKAAYYSPTAFGARGLLSTEVGNGEIGIGAGARAAGGMFGLGGLANGLRSMRSAGTTTGRIIYASQNHQPVVNVVYVVDFAGAERYGGRYAVQTSVTVKANLAVVEDLSILTLTSAKGQPGTLTVAQPIAIGGDFGTLADTTSTGRKVDNIVGSILGGGNSNHYNDLTFTAVADRYREGAVQATVAANTRLVERLASLR